MCFFFFQTEDGIRDFGVTGFQPCPFPTSPPGVGGLQHPAAEGVTGAPSPPRDPAGLGAVLAALLADDARRAAYGAAGVQRARSRYRWARVVADTDTVYRQVLARRRPVEVAR